MTDKIIQTGQTVLYQQHHHRNLKFQLFNEISNDVIVWQITIHVLPVI